MINESSFIKIEGYISDIPPKEAFKEKPEYFAISNNKSGIISRFKIIEYDNDIDSLVLVLDYYNDLYDSLSKCIRQMMLGIYNHIDDKDSFFVNHHSFTLIGIEKLDQFTDFYSTRHYPEIDRVEYNDVETSIYWKDGDKTEVSRFYQDTYDLEKAFALCVTKKVLLTGINKYNNLHKTIMRYINDNMVSKEYLMKVFKLSEHCIHLVKHDTGVINRSDENTDNKKFTLLYAPEDSTVNYYMVEFAFSNGYCGPAYMSNDAKILLGCIINENKHEIVIKEVSVNKYLTKRAFNEYLKQIFAKCLKDNYRLFTGIPFENIVIEEETN